jgi:hypothetical protein
MENEKEWMIDVRITARFLPKKPIDDVVVRQAQLMLDVECAKIDGIVKEILLRRIQENEVRK